MIWGAGAIAFATVVAIVLAWVYFNPPGQSKIITFYTTDAEQVRPGDEVRMAGIKVGEVEDLSLQKDQVRVRARINDDAFVGEQSQVDVRMLTVVGGYYVNVASIGDSPLGASPIPRERVTMPYSLLETLTDTTKITQNVDPKPVNESLDEIQQGLTGTNVEALAAIVDSGNSLMSTVERQRGQVTQILEMSNEYISALSGHREQIAQLVRKMSIITQSLVIYGREVAAATDGISDVVLALKPIGDFYEGHRVQFIEKVRQYQKRTRLFVERNGLTVRALRRVQNLFERVLDAQDAAPALLATDLCVPLPGSPC